MEVVVILLLILFNGVLAMAEIAIISARKSKLKQQAQEGNKRAQVALELSNDPNTFLSTIQIGITLVGILTGAFGGATIAEVLSKYFQTIPFLVPYSDILALTIVVAVITYLSLVIGEIVPKRLALTNPEKIAQFVARPLNTLFRITRPFVLFLSISTDWIFRVFHIKTTTEIPVSDEEVKLLLQEGTQSGVFDKAEQDIVERTFRLSDKRVNMLMRPRKEVVWLDIDSSLKTIRSKISKNPYAYFPVCQDNLDKVVGVVRIKQLLTQFLDEEKLDIKKVLQKPLFIPESMDGLSVLETFKKTGMHMAIVVDEYGNVQGVISLTDILEAIVGDIATIDEKEEKPIMKRSDGSFLVDGSLSLDEFKEFFDVKKIPGEKSGIFHTVGGFITNSIGRIPVSGDKFTWESFRFEVMDMDGNRVDKILVFREQ